MKLSDMGLLILLGAIIVGVGIAFVTKKDDTQLEEAAEMIIYQQTGVDVDLTPGSPEDASK